MKINIVNTYTKDIMLTVDTDDIAGYADEIEEIVNNNLNRYIGFSGEQRPDGILWTCLLDYHAINTLQGKVYSNAFSTAYHTQEIMNFLCSLTEERVRERHNEAFWKWW